MKDGSVSSNYDIDMTSINTRMFGIMFEVSLLVASLKNIHIHEQTSVYTH